MYNEPTIQSFEQILNETPIIKGDNAYFTCPSCHKPKEKYKFSVSTSKFLSHCFSCGYSANLFQLKKYLGLSFSTKEKYQPAPKIKHEVKDQAVNVDIDKPALNVLYQFLSTKLSNDIETLDLYKKLYRDKRDLDLNNDFLPLTPNYLNEFRANYSKEYNLLKSFLNISFHHRLIQFHRNFNNELDYFTAYLFDYHYEKYSNKDYEYVKSKKPSAITSKVYGRNSLNKPQIKGGLFFISESVDKTEALIQLGYSAIGLNGITNYKALDSALLELKNKIDSDNLEAVILLDSKQGIITPEVNSIIQIAEKLQSLNIRFSIASIPKPQIGSDIKDIDINDLLVNIQSPKAKQRAITKLLNKRVSFEVFKKNLGREKNLDTENIFRNPIKAAAGSKAIKSYDKLTIDEIRDQSLILKATNDFLNTQDKKLLMVKATAGSGKTHSILEQSRKKRTLYLTPNTRLINDIMISAEDKYIKAHYQKSHSEQCKDNHIEKNIDFTSKDSFYSKFKKWIGKSLNTKKLCEKCPLKTSCKAFKNQQQFSYSELKNDTNLLAMTIDKYISSDKQTQDAIAFFRPEIIVIDETMHLVNEISISKETLKLIEKYIVNQSDNENLKTLFKIVSTILKDLPTDETKKRGKALFNHFNKEYTGLKKRINSLSVKEIEETIASLELEEFLETEDLPDTKALSEVLRALKKDCKNIIVKDDEIVISTKKEFNLPDNLPIIHLDASAKLSLVSKELSIPEDKISFVDFKGFNPNLKVFQYSDSSNKNSALIKGSYKYERLVSLIKSKVLEKKKKTLVVVSLELENIMKQDPNLKDCLDSNNLAIEHHYSLRGRNDFKDYEVAIVTAPKINYKALESMAYTLYGIDKFEMDHKTIQTNIYHEKSKTYLKLEKSRVYKDDLMNDVVQKFQADEINQCSKRIDRKGNESKEIIILDQIDMTNVFYEDIHTFDFDYQKKKNKSKTDNLKNSLKELLESSKENNDFILYSDLENLILNHDEKNNNYGFQIAENLTNNTSRSFSYNIYNHIAKTTERNVYGTYSDKVLRNAVKTAISEIGFFEKNLRLCFDGKNYVQLNFIFSDNEKFSDIEAILKDKFKFVQLVNKSTFDSTCIIQPPILQSISKLECTDKFSLSNFGESSYINSQNKTRPITEVSIKEMVISEPVKEENHFKYTLDIVNESEKLIANSIKKESYAFISNLKIDDYIGFDDKTQENFFNSDYFETELTKMGLSPYYAQICDIVALTNEFKINDNIAYYLIQQYVKDFTYNLDINEISHEISESIEIIESFEIVDYIEPIPYENKTYDIEPVKELSFELSPYLKELSSLKMERVKLNIDSYFKLLKYKKLDKFIKNNLWNSAFYEFRSDFYINKINEHLGIFDLDVSKYLFDLYALKQNQTIVNAPIIPISKGFNTNIVNNQMSLF